MARCCIGLALIGAAAGFTHPRGSRWHAPLPRTSPPRVRALASTPPDGGAGGGEDGGDPSQNDGDLAKEFEQAMRTKMGLDEAGMDEELAKILSDSAERSRIASEKIS
ncbi:hypothetical protein T492DRAFT_853600 [Pavlovales sp. CCMP2436]|nr:hypothetical protein T492DRAFT_853600 [Pavlovales sp. CCMP2436]